MTDQKMDSAKANKTKPQELDEQDLDKAAGGYGRRMYYSYENDAGTSYQAKGDDSHSSN